MNVVKHAHRNYNLKEVIIVIIILKKIEALDIDIHSLHAIIYIR